MIAHLAGRETALEPFGWTGRKAEWIALACLHSGVFIRTQWSRFLNAHPEQARRGVHALIASGVAAEETVPHIRGIGRVCRIFSQHLYRALDAEDIRHRRIASPTVLMRRLLSLDYVLEHPDPCRGCRPSPRRSARSRRSASSVVSSPRGSTAGPPETPGGTSRSGCPSRSMATARCSSTPIPAMRP